MCGVMGYVTTKPEIAIKTKKYIQLLTKNLLESIFERGKDATGYLAHYNNTHATIYYKKPLTALTFLRRGYVDFKVMPDVFIGHTRAATAGNPHRNQNNHPLFHGDYGIVHNGTIGQWNKYTKYTSLMQTETDSELLAIYIAQKKGNLKEVGSVFSSALFAVVAMHIPSGLVTIARDSYIPLNYVDLSQHLGIILFASTGHILSTALSKTFKQYPAFTIKSFADYTAYTINSKGLKIAYELTHPHYSTAKSYNTDAADLEQLSAPLLYRNAEMGQIERVELEIQELFQTMLGAQNYRYYLAQFARQYYYNGTSWLDRSAEMNYQIAELFIEDLYETYGEDGEHKFY